MGDYGFFSKQEVEQRRRIEFDTERTGADCVKCGLYRSVRSPKMSYTGEGKLKCLVVGEAPGEEEDNLGEQWKGRAGDYLRNALRKFDLDLDRDFWKINAINCRPSEMHGRRKVNRTPTKQELEYCRPCVDKAIKELNPQFIWLFGGKAVESFMSKWFKDCSITRWRALCIPDRATNAFIIPLFHPSYVMRDEKNKNLTSTFLRDISYAVQCFKHTFPIFPDENKHIRILLDYREVLQMLEEILDKQPSLLAIDYETTGLKPYQPGHKIVSIALCSSEHQSYSFPFMWRDYWVHEELVQIKKRVRQVLLEKRIGKIAHNLKFENNWSREIIGTEIKGWVKCTMNAAHIEDNRSHYSGLKFQSYVHFGFLPYGQHLDRFLKAKGAFNQIEKAPLDQLLHYNGLDPLFTIKLHKLQEQNFDEKDQRAYSFWHEGLLELSKIEGRGIKTDEHYFASLHNRSKTGKLDVELQERRERLTNGPEAHQFQQMTGKKLDIGSTTDLGKLFYEVQGLPVINTEKGNYSVDKTALEKINTPFVHDLIRYRILEKVVGTYLAQFIRYSFNGYMHPTFDLHIPVSYRGSSSDPNFQNIPKHDEDAQRYCRSGIKPSKGRRLHEADFSGIEVGIGCCYHKDPNMIKYIEDESTDMHRDTASDIWKLKACDVTKKVRYFAKNGFVFPQFYGSWWKECSKNLWDNCVTLYKLTTAEGKPLREHLRDNGIISFEAFERHCQEVENLFWEDRFGVYKKWKEETNEEYCRTGVIETFLGFKIKGYLTRNEVGNLPIQGTAFHVLLWTLVEVAKVAVEEKWDSHLIGQIHDSMLTDEVPSETHHIIETINYIGTVKTREQFPWIIVPLKIDHETSKVDGNWYEMEEWND